MDRLQTSARAFSFPDKKHSLFCGGCIKVSLQRLAQRTVDFVTPTSVVRCCILYRGGARYQIGSAERVCAPSPTGMFGKANRHSEFLVAVSC